MAAMIAGYGSTVLLVCGKVRDSAGFAADLAVYRRWIEDGAIGSLVFSGWRSDESEHPDAIAEMRAMGAAVVLSPDPTFAVTGHIFHQMKNLYYGLGRIDPAAFVIKTRTDKVDLNFDLAGLIDRASRAPPPYGASPFDHRLMLVATLPFMPYFHNDMIFAGEAADLARLISFDLWFEIQGATINAEQIMHSAPYRTDGAERSRIDAFFRASPGLIHTSLEEADAAQALLLDDPLYRLVLCRSLERLLTSYTLGLTSPHEPWPDEIFAGATLANLSLLARTSAIEGMFYHAGANTIELRRPELLPMMLNMPISATEPRSLRQAVDEAQMAALPAPDALSDALKDSVRGAFPHWTHAAAPTIEEDGLVVHATNRPTSIHAFA